MPSEVRVEGLADVSRAFGKVSKDTKKSIGRELREIGKDVRDDGRTLSARRTRRRTGDLQRGIKHSVRRNSEVSIRSSASHRGYPYPLRLEFGHGGRYASLYEAAEKARPKVIRDLEGVVERAILANGFR